MPGGDVPAAADHPPMANPPGTLSPAEREPPPVTDRGLLAVDLGLRTGLAFYGADGRLRWYRSQNFGAPGRLRRAVPALLEGVSDLVVEGGGELASAWSTEAAQRAIQVRWVSAETWRRAFLYPREQR